MIRLCVPSFVPSAEDLDKNKGRSTKWCGFRGSYVNFAREEEKGVLATVFPRKGVLHDLSPSVETGILLKVNAGLSHHFHRRSLRITPED